MSFVSLEFLLLFIIIISALRIVRHNEPQKMILLVVSCLFYAYWDWQFLGIMIIVTLANYFISLKVYQANGQQLKKMWLTVGVVLNLLVLGYFKYLNFFVDSFNLILVSLGVQLPELKILLPVGISFYIFETLSYILDLYRGATKPAKSFLDYAIFATFFPRLVSGPIMRASHFLPQLERSVKFNRENFITGLLYFGQGLLKKIVIADTLRVLVDQVYQFPGLFSSMTVWLGVFSFSIQMYYDFSGYSDMATGIARMMGFEFPLNFNLPFTSRNITEFWQRWHISLSNWLRDYIFLPYSRTLLRRNQSGRYLPNIFFPPVVTMLLGGLWHGASWGFVIWGGLHGLILAFERYAKVDGVAGRVWNPNKDWVRTVWVFILSSLLSVLFRAPSLKVAWIIFNKLLFIENDGVNWFFFPGVLYILAVMFGGVVIRSKNIDFTLVDLMQPYTAPLIFVIYLVAFLFAAGGVAPFLYFQF